MITCKRRVWPVEDVDRREDSPITHLNTTLETIIEMSLSSTTSKDLSLDNESINTEIPCYFFCFIC